jgi:hypothetical protein
MLASRSKPDRSAQFEGRHAENAVHRLRWRIAGVHPGCLEDGAHAEPLDEPFGCVVRFGDVEEERFVADRTDETAQQALGGCFVVGEEWPDLEARPARSRDRVRTVARPIEPGIRSQESRKRDRSAGNTSLS